MHRAHGGRTRDGGALWQRAARDAGLRPALVGPGTGAGLADELGVTFPVLFDSRKEVSKLYEVEAMPVTVIVDRSGTVRYVHHGYKPGYEEKYLDQIRSLLRE